MGLLQSGYPYLHSDDEPVEAPSRASFFTVSKDASSAGLVQRTSGAEPAYSLVCRAKFENVYCSAHTKL